MTSPAFYQPINNWIIKGTQDSYIYPLSREIENYGDLAEASRRQINNYHINDTIISSIVTSFVSGVVGKGVNFQSRFEDDSTNKELEQLQKIHGRVGNFDVTGRYGLQEFIRQIESSSLLQGGCIIRHRYSSSWSVPYKLELISVDRIATSRGKNGFEYDRYGKITHIWLYTDARLSKAIRFSMKNMTYFSSPWTGVDQYTPISPLVRILPLLKQVADLRESELKSAKNRSENGIYWKTELYSAIQQKLADLKGSLGVDAAAAIAKEIMQNIADQAGIKQGLTPVPQGDDFFESKIKTESVYENLSKDGQMNIASSMGGSSASIFKDISQGNYSSIRAAMSIEEEEFELQFDKIKTVFLDEYFSRLFGIGVETGRIGSVKVSNYYADPEYYYGNWDILRTSKRSIDPAKEANAVDTALANGTMTRTEAFAMRGKDFETEVLREQETIKRIEDKIGKPYIPPSQVQQPQQTQPIEEI
jgi:capsid protein